ncbi:MAG: hypothetical protein ABSE20_20850 [Acetobacteraceae bacterium]
MSRTLRRIVAALCLATLLGGCVVVPARPGYYGPHYGWGWHYWR